MAKRVFGGLCLGVLLLGTGCVSQTVFLANFESETLGSPPTVGQQVGTINVDAGAGSVQVVPAPATATSHWVQISHPKPSSAPTAMQCNFSLFAGDGTYGLLAPCVIPTGAGVVTLQFEVFGQPVTDFQSFLHVDFLANNTVRINDTDTVFGTFPRDQVFTISATLTITETSATAHLQLFGNGASGEQDVAVTPVALARQLGAVRFWVGFQHGATFLLDQIVVTHKKP
jgi:hypothetical protein